MISKIISFQNILEENNLDGFIVTNPTNIFYLCGFKGVLPQERESILVFNLYPSKPRRSGATLITPRIYQNEARRTQSKNFKIKIVNERNQIYESAKNLLSQIPPRGESSLHLGGGRVGFEEDNLRFAEFKEFKKTLVGAKLIPCKNLIENLRVIKTTVEVKRIEKAQLISQKAFNELIKTIKVGQTEAEIAEKLTAIIKSLSADGLAFESIVAAGRNAGLPHYVTSKQKIKKGQVLLFDFGAKYKDYCADLSRTIFIGKTSDRQRNIYHHVLNAQKRAIEKITSGIKVSDVYDAANDYFKKHNLDEYFLHGLGHGIGLDVHETPHLRSGLPTTNDQLLTNGMVFSVEPGLYFPWGGIRIEDIIVIKNGRAKVLGKLIDEIIEV